jgi:prophage regulatory protein
MDRLLDWHQLSKIVPYSRQHIGRLEDQDKFPKRRWLSSNRVAWLESEVLEWLESRQPGGPPQKADLGPRARPTAPEPDPAEIELMHRLLAKYGVEIRRQRRLTPERRGVGDPP